MSDLAQLLTSIAGLISALGGVIVGYLALVRGSRREREQAAQNTLDQLTSRDQDEAQWAAIEDLRRRLGGGER